MSPDSDQRVIARGLVKTENRIGGEMLPQPVSPLDYNTLVCNTYQWVLDTCGDEIDPYFRRDIADRIRRIRGGELFEPREHVEIIVRNAFKDKAMFGILETLNLDDLLGIVEHTPNPDVNTSE